jgi:hypothetical protein
VRAEHGFEFGQRTIADDLSEVALGFEHAGGGHLRIIVRPASASRGTRLLDVNYFAGRIDSRFLLPERRRLPQ